MVARPVFGQEFYLRIHAAVFVDSQDYSFRRRVRRRRKNFVSAPLYDRRLVVPAVREVVEAREFFLSHYAFFAEKSAYAVLPKLIYERRIPCQREEIDEHPFV